MLPVKTFLLIIFIVLFPHSIFAEARDSIVLGDSIKHRVSPLEVSLELSTKYVWRGIEYGVGPTTFGKISFQNKGFDAYLEGVYDVKGIHAEVDLGVGYTYKWLYIGLADYYYPSPVGEKDKYFKLSNRNTGHYIEAYSMLTPTKLPLQLTLSCYVFGADKNKKGHQAFSSYAELTYSHIFKDDNVLSLFLGTSLNKGFYTDYQSSFNIVNVSLKYETKLKFGSFYLPVSASYIINPYREKSYFTLSVFFNSRI